MFQIRNTTAIIAAQILIVGIRTPFIPEFFKRHRGFHILSVKRPEQTYTFYFPKD